MIPVNVPLFSGNEGKYLQECIQTGWISSEGPFVSKFETEFAKYIGMRYGIAVSNGSAALDIAVQALGLGTGDQVIMPTFTIVSPAFSVIRAGATPVLIDSDPVTWNMDVGQIEKKIKPETKAIIVVHTYGLPVDINPVISLCQKYNLFLIEDAAEMIGQTYYDAKVGSFGHLSIFSFYPNKHITTGEGGMILCNDGVLADRCKKLRNLAFEPDKPRFVHYEMGWNYRMTNFQAAMGLAQLEKIDEHISRKREIGLQYDRGLSMLANCQMPLPTTPYANNIYWVFGIVAKNEQLKEEWVAHLNRYFIGTRPFFWCMHEQPVFLKMGLFANESYPVAELLARNGFYIPSGLGLKNNEIDTVIDTILLLN